MDSILYTITGSLVKEEMKSTSMAVHGGMLLCVVYCVLYCIVLYRYYFILIVLQCIGSILWYHDLLGLLNSSLTGMYALIENESR